MRLTQHEKLSPSTIGVLLVVALIVGSYLASYFFKLSLHESPFHATPLTIFQAFFDYADEPVIQHKVLLYFLLSLALPLAGIVWLYLPEKPALHGEARFASRKEIKQAGLFSQEGLFLGKYQRNYLLLPGQQSAMCAAPPRSGKGLGLVQTNMLNWASSVVILDIRQESFRLTSGYRAQFMPVFLFNPLAEDTKTCCWNPLHYVSHEPHGRINDLQKIAVMLFPDPLQGDSFWMASSRTLFLGLALYVFETPHLPKTIGEILRQILWGEGESISEHWKKIIEDRKKSHQSLSDTCMRALYDFIFTSSNTQSSIRKTFTARLELWLNPMVDLATRRNDFDLRDLRKKPMTLYIGVTPDNLERLQPILNLFFQQLLDLNTRDMTESNAELKYPLLLLMDELTAIGRIPILAKSISFIGGYNIRMLMVIQSPSQLRATYGHEDAETMMTCMAAHVVFTPREQRHAQEISEALGYQTVASESRTQQLGFSKTGGSKNTSPQQRALMLPQEIKAMGKDQAIIFMENIRPILCKKVIYFEESVFKARQLPPVEIKPLSQDSAGKQIKQLLQQVEGLMTRLVQVEQKAVHSVTVEDISYINELNLADFAVDAETIQLPRGKSLTDSELKEAVSQYLGQVDPFNLQQQSDQEV